MLVHCKLAGLCEFVRTCRFASLCEFMRMCEFLPVSARVRVFCEFVQGGEVVRGCARWRMYKSLCKVANVCEFVQGGELASSCGLCELVQGPRQLLSVKFPFIHRTCSLFPNRVCSAAPPLSGRFSSPHPFALSVVLLPPMLFVRRPPPPPTSPLLSTPQ